MVDVAFRVDAGIGIGGGHLARCSALAATMNERGWNTVLYGSAETIRLTEGANGFAVRTPLADEVSGNPDILPGGFDLLVIDHYGLGLDYETRAHKCAPTVLVISDDCDRQRAAEMLVDQNIGRTAADYHGVVPQDSKVLAGLSYVMLQPDFSRNQRPTVPKLREQARNLLVTFGASDPLDMTSRALELLRNAAMPGWRVRVVLGPSYAHGDKIALMKQDWPALEIEHAPPNLLVSMLWADAAITAAGGTCWELCYLGVPFAVATLATLPNTNARRLNEQGAALDLGTSASLDGSKLDQALRILMGPIAVRREMATRAYGLVDGRGADRVCDRIEERLCAA